MDGNISKDETVIVRVRVKTQRGVRTFWAERHIINGQVVYLRLNRRGERVKYYGRTLELTIASAKDVLFEKRARINPVYGLLEVEDEQSATGQNIESGT